jgi:hypothetical protein
MDFAAGKQSLRIRKDRDGVIVLRRPRRSAAILASSRAIFRYLLLAAVGIEEPRGEGWHQGWCGIAAWLATGGTSS